MAFRDPVESVTCLKGPKGVRTVRQARGRQFWRVAHLGGNYGPQ